MSSERRCISEAAIFAQARLQESLPLETLAAVARLSPHHFHRVFKQETGETPAAFVQRLRLEQVAFRLLLHDETVLQIALDCGFRNPETLSRAFAATSV
ncbi:MAG: helix-turn-helix transcriptional regulator [Pseudomonadota bacterium]